MGNTESAESPSSPSSPKEIESAHEGHHEHGDNCEGCESTDECKPLPLPYNPNLAATVGYYERAVIVCSGALDWPNKLEKTPGNYPGSFVHTIAKAIKSRGDEVSGGVKITACGEPSSSGEGTDIYVYPDSVKYLGVKESDIATFIEDQLVKGEVSTRIKHVSVSGKYHVLVCTHNTRDKRCGRSGKQVLSALQDMVREKGEAERVMVDGCSHVGGHKYAGVVVVYPPGDYYGYIGAKNVDEVVKHYLDPKKPRANQFWRGRMGTDQDDQAKEAGMSAPKKKKDKGGERRDKGEKREKGERGEKETKQDPLTTTTTDTV